MLTLPPHRSQIREGVVKIVDGVLFGVRGVKLLFSDIGSAGKLFWRAVRGESRLLRGGWEGRRFKGSVRLRACLPPWQPLLLLGPLDAAPCCPPPAPPCRRHAEAARGAGAAAYNQGPAGLRPVHHHPHRAPHARGE